MKIVKESIEFKRGRDFRQAMGIRKEQLKDKEVYIPHIKNAIQELNDLGIDARWQANAYNDEIIEIEIPSLIEEDVENGKNYRVGFLPYDERDWASFGAGEDEWGWGVWNDDDGVMLIENSFDWEVVKAKILELLKADPKL